MSFEKLGLSEEMVRACEEVLGVVLPSEIQCVGVPPVLSGSSVVMSAPSGSGRTLAYLLPLLQVYMYIHMLFVLLYSLVVNSVSS